LKDVMAPTFVSAISSVASQGSSMLLNGGSFSWSSLIISMGASFLQSLAFSGEEASGLAVDQSFDSEGFWQEVNYLSQGSSSEGILLAGGPPVSVADIAPYGSLTADQMFENFQRSRHAFDLSVQKWCIQIGSLFVPGVPPLSKFLLELLKFHLTPTISAP
jgi:hypothetical protein